MCSSHFNVFPNNAEAREAFAVSRVQKNVFVWLRRDLKERVSLNISCSTSCFRQEQTRCDVLLTLQGRTPGSGWRWRSDTWCGCGAGSNPPAKATCSGCWRCSTAAWRAAGWTKSWRDARSCRIKRGSSVSLNCWVKLDLSQVDKGRNSQLPDGGLLLLLDLGTLPGRPERKETEKKHRS